MKIFTDFDDTIFNTKRFKNDFVKVFNKNGISKEEFNRTYYNHSIREVGGYDFEKQLELINWPSEFSRKKAIQDFKELIDGLNGYVFEDFYSFVKKFDRENLFLISFGDSDFKNLKIKKSGVAQYFKEYKVVKEEGKGVFIKNCALEREKLFLIDDRPEQLRIAKEEVPQLVPIRIKRKEGRYNNLEGDLNVFTSKSLKEAEEIIMNNI
ncbi:MAG: hypothetical protein R6V40_04530 [Candidatus Moraniibacteriota bacterium]